MRTNVETETKTAVEDLIWMWLDEDLEEIEEDESNWRDEFESMLDEEEFEYDYDDDYDCED